MTVPHTPSSEPPSSKNWNNGIVEYWNDGKKVFEKPNVDGLVKSPVLSS
jgi:hypothetical protein